jgi:hypothetical protein
MITKFVRLLVIDFEVDVEAVHHSGLVKVAQEVRDHG